MGRLARFVAMSGSLSLGVAALVVLPAAPAVADPVPCSGTFAATGETQCTVGAGVTALTVEAIGGDGANAFSGSSGGAAAHVTATIPVSANETLYVEVGGDASGTSGGANGGGNGTLDGGGGGGASDVRTCSGCSLTADADDPRLVVAGGGGGGGYNGGGGGGNAGVSSLMGAGAGGTGDSSPSAGGDGGLGAGGGSGGGSNGSVFNDHGNNGSPGTGGGVGSPVSYGGGGGGGFTGGGGGGDGDSFGGGGGAGSSFVESAATGTPTVTTASSGDAPEVVLTPNGPPPLVPTSTTLTFSANPATAGQSVTATATVSPAPVGGSVRFILDGQYLGNPVVVSPTHQSASITFPAPATPGEHAVSALYSGDTLDGPSVDNKTLTVEANPAVTNPTLTATAVSYHPLTRYGWYRGPVEVAFSCKAGSAPLAAPGCPDPVDLSRGGTYRLTRTITATDGGTATVTKTVKIDQAKPHLHLRGVTNGQTYRQERTITCKATDKLSGIASCDITQHRSRSGRTMHYKATATDKAGNKRHKKGHYALRRHRKR